jgi:hypothetical protein
LVDSASGQLAVVISVLCTPVDKARVAVVARAEIVSMMLVTD